MSRHGCYVRHRRRQDGLSPCADSALMNKTECPWAGTLTSVKRKTTGGSHD
jgi:hypothetical protein